MADGVRPLERRDTCVVLEPCPLTIDALKVPYVAVLLSLSCLYLLFQFRLAWGFVGVNACSAVFGIRVRGFGTVAPCHGDERFYYVFAVFGMFDIVRQLHGFVFLFG
jgi:hypothetical protein